MGAKTNPLDKSGNISCCAMCQSICHWANDCPSKLKEDFSNDAKITLFTQDVHSCYIEKFVGETLHCIVLDTGCTKNVCGQSWLDSYLDSLTPGDLLKVVGEKSSSSFKVGDGNTVLSTKAVTILATIGKDDVLIKTDVIQNDIPLLLSKDSMKQSNVKIDFANDKVSFLDQNVDIILTSSGHYAVPICRMEKLLVIIWIVLMTQKRYF